MKSSVHSPDTRGATRKDVDAIWPAFQPYFTCVEQKLNTLKPQIEVMDEVFVILGAVSEEKICLEQFQAIRGDFIARHKSLNSGNLLKITEMVRTYAGFEASFDRISGGKISIP